jgi:bifunctional oligoribonuclease and PAP phosphatase NrnA
MQNYSSEFKTLEYIIAQAKNILLVAHTRPDPDTVGSNSALHEHLVALGKNVTITCYDSFPDVLIPLGQKEFVHPDTLELGQFDAVFALDSVDRGFHLFRDKLREDQVVVLMDHHPDIELHGDVVIIDKDYSSTSEILYLYFKYAEARITKRMATYLLAGLVFDTGGFKHSKVSPQVMEIASQLMQKGAPLEKVSQIIFAHQNIGALRLWGKAIEKARLYPSNGMLVTAVTEEEIGECDATPDDIYQVVSILSTIPEAKFTLVLSQRDKSTVRGSLRSMDHHNVDVSQIAHQFGGGGHHLASGFEVPGRIVETGSGFAIL